MQRYSSPARLAAPALAAALAAALASTATSILWTAFAQAADAPRDSTSAPIRQAPTPPHQPPDNVTQLDLSPAAFSVPALKYRLTPRVAELTPGNATTSYFRAFLLLEDLARGHQEVIKRLESDHLSGPLAILPREQVRRDLERFQPVLELAEAAARQEACLWDSMPPSDARLMPELYGARRVVRLLTARVRLEIAEGSLDRALRTLQTEYAFARQMTQQRTVISKLVGIAIRDIASHFGVESFIAAPDAPNLYWALAALPSSQNDVRQTFDLAESEYPGDFPSLRDVENAKHAPERWRFLWKQFLRERHELHADTLDKPLPPRDPEAMLERVYPAACSRLIQRGRTRAQVESMPRERAVLIDAIETYREIFRDGARWWTMPYPACEALPNFGIRGVPQEDPLSIALSAVRMLELPRRAATCSDRTVAALCVIEALRHYAHGHGGRLPERLDQITDVPLPPDPITGKPFVYQLHGGDLGVLDAVGPMPTQPRRWKIGIRKPAAR